MKKVFLTLAAITLVLAVIGCPNGTGGSSTKPGVTPGPGVQLEEKVVFDMATDAGIQALVPGDLTFEPGDAGNPIKPLQKSGEIPDGHLEFFRAQDKDGTIVLHYKTLATWGPGIDLPNRSFAYYVGDSVKIVGEVLAMPGGGKIQLNRLVNSENSNIGGEKREITTTGPFEWDIVLAEGDMNDITKGATGGGPAGIRIESRGAANIEVRIDNITIKGLRPSTVVALPAPVISLEGDVLSWDAVSGAAGYAVYISGETDPRSTNATSFNLSVLAPDTYTVQVAAKGVPGISLDSPKSNSVSYTRAPLALLPAGFYELGPLSDGGWWYSNGADGNVSPITTEIVKGAKYLILELLSKPSNNGFGGMQLAIQHNGDGWAWHQEDSAPGWTQPSGAWELDYSGEDTFYLIFDLNQVTIFADFLASDATQAKFKYNTFPSQCEFANAYLCTTTLSKPANFYDLSNGKGWVAPNVPPLVP